VLFPCPRRTQYCIYINSEFLYSGRRRIIRSLDVKRARLGRRPLHGIREDFEVEVALAGAVELGEEDALPGAEDEFAIFDENDL
jgi:hypothetical protein